MMTALRVSSLMIGEVSNDDDKLTIKTASTNGGNVPCGSDENQVSSSRVDKSTIAVVTADKPTPDSKVGISLQRNRRIGLVLVQSIAEGGLFSSSGLKVGQAVISINGTPCPNEIKTVGRLIADSTETLTLEVGDLVKSQ